MQKSMTGAAAARKGKTRLRQASVNWSIAVVRAMTCGALIWTIAAGVSPAGVLVEAHRGNSSIAPENTIAAIAAAAGVADLTEWDVQATADGEFILMHDSTVNRTTDGTGAVASLTLAQIQALDAGSWFSPAFAGESVPTFSEALDAALAYGLQPLIERKAGGSPLDYHLLFLNKSLAPTQFRVICFDWGFLDGLDQLDSAYNLGALGSGAITQSVIDSAKAAGADFLDWEHSSLTPTIVDLVHANGLELHAWTVDAQSRMQQLIDMGIDGITTNVPAVLRPLAVIASRTADLNGDHVVDALDWLQYNGGRGASMAGFTDAQAYAAGDLDGDFDNDLADFVRFKSLYLQANGPGALQELLAVPEPISSSTAVIGFAVLASRRWKSSLQSKLSRRECT